jgi:hypothetical protein
MVVQKYTALSKNKLGLALTLKTSYSQLPGCYKIRKQAPLLVRSFKFSSYGLVCSALLFLASFGIAHAEPSTPLPIDDDFGPYGIHILNGLYVLNAGELHVNITNHGLIGSQYTLTAPYSDAPSAQWPGGTGDEYLWGAGLWVGGKIGSDIVVSTGQYEREFRPKPDLEETIYEARAGQIIRPNLYPQITGRRRPDPDSNDDHDYKYDEDPLNGKDDDGDGLVDEDFAQIGDQMFTCTMYDNLPIITEIYPEHRPMGLRVIQSAYAWNSPEQENIIGLDFTISNIGYETIEDVYLGFLVDCDIQRRSTGPSNPDDLAGFFNGSVRAEDGTFYRADIAYMMDGARDNPLPGCFGVMLIDHTTEFIGNAAPFHPAINSFQVFSANAPVEQEGEPLSDVDRYFAMAQNRFDNNTPVQDANDFKMLISSGPFTPLEPGMTLNYRLALIIGDGLEGMLETAVEAGRLGHGRWFDVDNNYYTGRFGRETRVCLGDYPPWPSGRDPIYDHRLNFMNEECAGSFPIMFQDIIWADTLIPDGAGNWCAWVNMDNCEECFRARGYNCTPDNFFSTYTGRTRTGVYGRETRFPWSDFRDNPPPAPNFRLVPGDRSVELFWNDISEFAPDPTYGVIDFESYQIWRAGNWTRPEGTRVETSPPTEMWEKLAEHDLVNFIDPNISNSHIPLSLGQNTGLHNLVYVPNCLNDERFFGLAEEMQIVVDSDIHGMWLYRPPLRNPDGSVVNGMEGLMRWESYPTVLDTFFSVASREPGSGIVGKRSQAFYHYLDSNRPNGFNAYYSVTASDHSLVYWDENFYPSGYGSSEKAANHFQVATPRPEAQTLQQRQEDGLNIYVYPNPATRESLEEYLAQAASYDDPTGIRVTWNNLPLAHNTIYIFTASGDLVEIMDHDGFSEGGSTSWNLMSRNGQEVANGIYLYVVKSNDGSFADVPGRFVVIR